MGIEGTYLNMIKAIYDIPTGNIILDENIPAKFRNKTRMPTLTTSIQHSIGSLSDSNQTRKRNKRYPRDFSGGTVVKNPPANAGDTGLSPGPGESHMPQSN